MMPIAKMPRQNRTPINRRRTPAMIPPKRRYPSRLAAQRVADQQMTLHPGLELHVYQAAAGGWYLTRRQPQPLQSKRSE